jgi:hypothetical protein
MLMLQPMVSVGVVATAGEMVVRQSKLELKLPLRRRNLWGRQAPR